MKKRIASILTAAVFLVSGTGLSSVSATEQSDVIHSQGVYEKDGKYYYFNADGSIYQASGKKMVNGKYYYFNEDNSLYVDGWKTIDKKKSYFTKEGAAAGWTKINKKHYYFSETGNLKTNTIVGKYYVNKKGQRVTDKAAMKAVQLVKKISQNKKYNTKEKKLKACYDHISRNYTYKRSYEDPRSKGKRWYSSYANKMFTNGQGNCYMYASAFAYCAEVLGYDARVIIGKVGVYGGAPSAPHGWTETRTSGGKIYMYDPNMQMYTPGVNSYKKTYKNPPRKYKKEKMYDVSL